MVLKTSYDRANDVIYIKKEGCHIANSKECADDSMLILNYDLSGKIVGIQLMYASELKEAPHYVDDYPLTHDFKVAILQTLDLDTTVI